MGKAKFVKMLDSERAVQKLYKVDPPMEYDIYNCDDEEEAICSTEYVAVSALASAFDTGRPETYIFPADEEGKILDWGEIGASQRGTTDHEKVLRESGYEEIS